MQVLEFSDAGSQETAIKPRTNASYNVLRSFISYHKDSFVLIIYDNKILSEDVLLYFVMIKKLESERVFPRHPDITAVLQTK